MNETQAQEWIADRIEPLAVSMAALAEDARQAMEQMHQQAEKWSDQQREIIRYQNEAWSQQQQKLVKQWDQVAQTLERQSQAATKATRALMPKLWIMVMAAVLVIAVAAPSTYTLWQHRYSQTAKQQAEMVKVGTWFKDKYNSLDPVPKKKLDKILGIGN